MHWKLDSCREGSENVTFEFVNINGIVGAVLDVCSFGCRTDVWEEFESERFVIGLVGFVLRKVCDNSRAGSSNEKIKGMTIIVSWKVDVLVEMEIIKDARKFVRSSLKSPLMMSSDGDGTKIPSRFWNSSRKVDILEDGGRQMLRKMVSLLPVEKFSSQKIQVEICNRERLRHISIS